MSKSNTCCFTGHRILAKDFSTNCLKRGIEYLIGKGVDTFVAGGALGFDTQAALAVIELKKKHPQIKLHIYAPCKNQDRLWRLEDKLKYKSILDKADFVDMPDYDYWDGCMQTRNRKMVDASSYCIAYLDGRNSGTKSTVTYAKSRGLEVFNIYGKE